MSTEPLIAGRALSCALDFHQSSAATKAAYVAGIKALAGEAAPAWIQTSASDGVNLLGRSIPHYGVAAGWTAMPGKSIEGPLKAFRRMASDSGLQQRVVRAIADECRTRLGGPAYYAMMARSSRLCRPTLLFDDLHYGPERSQTIKAAQALYADHDQLHALHQLVLAQFEDRPAFNGAAGQVVAVQVQDAPAVQLDHTILDRACYDTAYSLALAPIAVKDFATAGQVFRVLAAEFRRRLWAGGGIYSAGMELSFGRRTISWWTHLDRKPAVTLGIVRDLVAEASGFVKTLKGATGSLGLMPPRLPAWLGSNAQGSVDWIFGLTEADRNCFRDAAVADFDVTGWLNADQQAAFCICGPELADDVRHDLEDSGCVLADPAGGLRDAG